MYDLRLERLRQRYPDLDDVNYVVPGESWSPDALAVARHNTNNGGYRRVEGADIEFYRFLTNVVAAGGWKIYVRAPRVALVVLHRLCEKDRARPPPELARLFALDKFIFWRVLSFWRSEREMPVCLMNTDVPAPPPPEHQFLPEEKFLPPPPKE